MIMRALVVVACVTCLVHGSRVRSREQEGANPTTSDTSNPLKTFATFIAASNPTSAFNPTAPSALSRVNRAVGRVSDVGMAPRKAAKKAAKKAVPKSKTSLFSKTDYAQATGGSSRGGYQPLYDEIGVLPPLGRWDPLKIRDQGPERYRRFVEMEIKHGRLAMAAFLGVLTTYSGVRFPGYLSIQENIKFEDMPGGAISSWAALPKFAWFQIVLAISFAEKTFFKQDPEKEAGNVVPDDWIWARYPDGYQVFLGDQQVKEVGEDELFLGRNWKLNAERNNGRAAMMGITGMIIHEALTGNPIFPIGGSGLAEASSMATGA